MKLKDKIKSYSFWVSLASAIILILKILGTRFGFSVDETMISDLFTALCSILVLLGIIAVPSNTQTTQINNQADKEEVKNNTVNNTLKQDIQTLEDAKENEVILDESENTTHNKELTNSDNIEPIIQELNTQSVNQNNTDVIDKKLINKEESQLNKEQSTEIITLTNETNQEKTLQTSTLKSLFEIERNKFAGNLDAYILELQEEIRKTREGV